MLDDRRLDSKLSELQRELKIRQPVAGFPIADAFTVRGVDESGRAGLFAAVLLGTPVPLELGTLTAFRNYLTQKLKQIDTSMPAWPIVVQGAPELINGEPVVPGGPQYFESLKAELLSRSERAKVARRTISFELPIRIEPTVESGRPQVSTRSATSSRTGARRTARAVKSVGKPARARR
jgi:hypothetical protein